MATTFPVGWECTGGVSRISCGSLQCCCRDMQPFVLQQKALGLLCLFRSPDAILHRALKSAQLLNPSSFMSAQRRGSGSAPSLLLLLEGCWVFFPTLFFLWDFAVFSAFFNYDFTSLPS